MFKISKFLLLKCFLSPAIVLPSLYHVIKGDGNPAALHGKVTFCFSFTVMEGEGFVTKCGDSVNVLKQVVLVIPLSRFRCKLTCTSASLTLYLNTNVN